MSKNEIVENEIKNKMQQSLIYKKKNGQIKFYKDIIINIFVIIIDIHDIFSKYYYQLYYWLYYYYIAIYLY